MFEKSGLFRKLRKLDEIVGDYRGRGLWLIAVVFVCAFVEGVGLAMILPLLDVVINGADGGTWGTLVRQMLPTFPERYVLPLMCVLFITAILMKNLMLVYKAYLAAEFTQGLRGRWMEDIYEGYLRAPYAFVQKHKQGKLVNDVMSEPTFASNCLAQLVELLTRLMLVSILFVILLAVNWKVTLGVGLGGGLVIAGTYRLLGTFSENIGKRRVRKKQELSNLVVDGLSGALQVRAFNLQNLLAKRFRDDMSQLVRLLVRFIVAKILPNCFGEVVAALMVVLGILYFYYLRPDDLVSMVPFIGLLVVVGAKLASNMATIVKQRMLFYSVLPSLRVVRDLIITGDDCAEQDEKKQEFKALAAGVSFENVHFSYGDKSVLANFSMEILKGKMTALVGPSGAGKSTITNLLLGFYRVDSGRIRIDGAELEQWDMESWRSRIGIVTQDCFVFNMSLAENIRLGKVDATDEEVRVAAKAAGAHEFIIASPKGYDTLAGNRGDQLSGGQRQRIAIARALIRKPELLVLDEATSALDHEMEECIQQTINALSGKVTILIIAHNQQTIRRADHVVTLDGGCTPVDA